MTKPLVVRFVKSLDVKQLYDAVNVILSLQVIVRYVALEAQSWNLP